MSIPTRTLAPLEIIRFAAANQLCVDLRYKGGVRRIEAYSLRQTREGNYVLHAVRSESGEARSYRIDQIEGATVAQQSFAPRYLVELTTEGPLFLPQAATRLATWGTPTSRRPAQATTAWGNSGPIYIFRCPICDKTFRRKTMDGKLNPHKNPSGWDCPGRQGIEAYRL